MTTHYVMCIQNDGYAASLEVRKIYQAISDTDSAEKKMIRVIDESGEDYLFPEEFFVPIQIPKNAERIFAAV